MLQTKLITNIKLLAGIREQSHPLRGNELANLPALSNAYLIIEDNAITDFGPMEELIHHAKNFTETYDATGQTILPAWCDSHTHLVFAASREDEFIDKIKGLSYA